jgi:hypothetical protein
MACISVSSFQYEHFSSPYRDVSGQPSSSTIQVKVVLVYKCQLHQFGIHFATLLLIYCLLCDFFTCATLACNGRVFHDRVTFSHL